jgi:predicted ArsR family transcriptional regulator
MQTADHEQRTSRLLADERRLALVELLRAAGLAGADASDLAEQLGLHVNTVRWHLGLLAEAGLVSSEGRRRAERGRPRISYRLSEEGKAAGRDDYRLLATMLAAALARDGEGAARANAVGRDWGAALVCVPAEQSEEAAAGAVVELLDEHGFGARLEAASICAHRCPFHALAEQSPDVVCGVHRGIVDGALRRAGSSRHVTALKIFVEPNLCRLELG